jgi:hypothetical protein
MSWESPREGKIDFSERLVTACIVEASDMAEADPGPDELQAMPMDIKLQRVASLMAQHLKSKTPTQLDSAMAAYRSTLADWMAILFDDALQCGRTPEEARGIVEVAQRWKKIRDAYGIRDQRQRTDA